LIQRNVATVDRQGHQYLAGAALSLPATTLRVSSWFAGPLPGFPHRQGATAGAVYDLLSRAIAIVFGHGLIASR
jgi:hypothetical protein